VDEKRFQDCSKLEKLWRYRHYLLIPFSFFYSWLYTKMYEFFGDKISCREEWILSARDCWSISIGMAQVKMKWYYEWKEVKESLDKKLGRDSMEEKAEEQ